MSKIIFCDTYIIVLPGFTKVSSHKHPFLHIFMGENNNINVDGKLSGSGIIMLDERVSHILEDNHNNSIFLLIDNSCDIADTMREKYLSDKKLNVIYDFIFDNSILDKSDDEIREYVENIFSTYGITNETKHIPDERIESLVKRLKSGELLDKKVTELADEMFLSESRLTHLFQDTMGISLKSYLILRRLEYAYKLVLDGKSITYASSEAGFATPAHLAYTCKKLMGISIRDVLR